MQKRVVCIALAVAFVGVSTLNAQPPSPQAKPQLGIAVSEEKDGKGLTVRDVAPGSPAAAAGLRPGDVLLAIDGKQIQNFRELSDTVGGRKPGDKLEVRISRDGKEQPVTVTLRERPGPREIAQPSRGRAFLGIQAQELTPEMKKRLDVAVDQGAVVDRVYENTPASKGGLQKGDVITRIGESQISGPRDLTEALKNMKVGQEVALNITRGKDSKELKVRLEDARQSAPFFTDFPFPQIPNFEFPNPLNRMQELERRIEELERRLRELEKQPRK